MGRAVRHARPALRGLRRANASLGLNGTVLNNVNAHPEQFDADHLKKAAALANVFRPYGIRVYFTANFAAPKVIGGLPTTDPLDPQVRQWWEAKADEIHALIPDLGGWLVKANSEGQPGPQDYRRTHADGANVMAEALAPHGGIIMWRAFVYNTKPNDDQEPREPFHPLFSAMPKTALMAELEITRENMAHRTDIAYLGSERQEVLGSDTFANGNGSTVAKILESGAHTGVAGVANIGKDRKW